MANVDLQLMPGSVAGLIGPNGSGKSTLLNALAGTLTLDSGVISHQIENQDAILKPRISFLSQEPALDPDMTVGQTLRLFATLYGLHGDLALNRINSLLTLFGLSQARAQLVAHCSGGMRQRLHICLGFLPDSNLYLFDEPTQALDPQGRETFWSVLTDRLQSGAAALVSLHDMQEASSKCSHVHLLAAGQMQAEGSPQELVQKYGASIWRGRLAHEPVEVDTIRHALMSLGGIRTFLCHKNNVLLTLDVDSPVDQIFVDALNRIGIRLEAYERRIPDMESVYYGLAIPINPLAAAGLDRGNDKKRGRNRRGGTSRNAGI